MKHEWEVYTRGVVPVHRLWMAMEGHMRHAVEYNGAPAGSNIFATNETKTWWAWNKKEINGIGERLWKKLRDPEKLKAHLALMEEIGQRAIKQAETVRLMDLTALSDEELTTQYEKLIDEAGPSQGFLNYDIDAMDIVPSQRLKELLRKECGDKGFKAVFSRLTTPVYKSYSQEEQDMLLHIAREGKTDFSAVLAKYWWTSLGWEWIKPNTKKCYAERVEELKKHDVDALIAESESHAARVEEKAALMDELGLSEEARYWLDVFEKYTLWHDRRKEIQVRAMYSFYLILCEIAQRKDASPSDLEWLYGEELLAFLETRELDEEEIKRRKHAVTVLVKEQQLHRWSGDEALRKKKELLPSKSNDTNEVQGEVASPGIVHGTAKVCAGAAQALEKVEEGDILICGMTLPEYVPAMKRAAGIVTDEGGITCHAAIVARELKKPCVIATRIATEVFKDGDKLEVDAEKGIVRKL